MIRRNELDRICASDAKEPSPTEDQEARRPVDVPALALLLLSEAGSNEL